jgi:hypothetical protein
MQSPGQRLISLFRAILPVAITTASSASNEQNPFFYEGWATNGFLNIQLLYYLGNEYFPAGGSLAVDANGNLYGTTCTCGTYNSGTVWQFSP